MWRPVCGYCLVEMDCVLNGVTVILRGEQAEGDCYGCPSCGAQTITGFGRPTPLGDRAAAAAATPSASQGTEARAREGGVSTVRAGSDPAQLAAVGAPAADDG